MRQVYKVVADGEHITVGKETYNAWKGSKHVIEIEDKKYGGETIADLKELLDNCEEAGIGLDSLMGDEAFASSVISDMIDELEKN